MSASSLFRIRPATGRDIPAIAAIEKDAARLFPPGRIPNPDETTPVAEVLDAIAFGLAWIAERGGGVAGFAIAEEVGDDLHLWEMDVAQAFARRGVGTALAGHVIEEARARNLSGVTLTTFDDLPWNRPFYERIGFRQLASNKVTPRLKALLDEEARAGMTLRIAMRFDLDN